jgi:hypothetical protein
MISEIELQSQAKAFAWRNPRSIEVHDIVDQAAEEVHVHD